VEGGGGQQKEFPAYKSAGSKGSQERRAQCPVLQCKKWQRIDAFAPYVDAVQTKWGATHVVLGYKGKKTVTEPN